MNLINTLKAPSLRVDSDIDEIIRPNRYLLTCVGLWPLVPNSSFFSRSVAWTCSIVTVLLCTAMTIPQFITLFVYWGDLKVLSDVGSTLLACLIVLFKIVYVIIRRKAYRAAYEFTCEFWKIARNQEERNNIVKLANNARFCTIFFFYSGSLDYILFTGSPLLITLYNYMVSNGSNYFHKLPVDLWYGFDTQVSPNYECLYMLQTLAIAVSVIAAVGIDCTMMSIIMQIAAQFRLISLRLRNIGRQISNGCRFDESPDNNLSLSLRDCIMHHQKLFCVFQSVDELVGPMILWHMLLAAVQLCLGGWSMTQSKSDLVNTIKFTIFMMIMGLQMLLWCWPGEAIIRESLNIGHVIFCDIPWPMLPCTVQRDLTIIIRRSQKQSQLTAIKLQVMCLKKLAEVFNTAISYTAVLRSMKEK